jgi:hypothetical protein
LEALSVGFTVQSRMAALVDCVQFDTSYVQYWMLHYFSETLRDEFTAFSPIA